MVGESRKMKISISVEEGDYNILTELVKSGRAANLSHAVRICIADFKRKEVTA